MVEGSYKILFANMDLFVFPDEGIPIPQEHYFMVNVELIRGYRSLSGYVVVTGDKETVKSFMKVVEHLLDDDVVLLVHKPTDPCIRVA